MTVGSSAANAALTSDSNNFTLLFMMMLLPPFDDLTAPMLVIVVEISSIVLLKGNVLIDVDRLNPFRSPCWLLQKSGVDIMHFTNYQIQVWAYPSHNLWVARNIVVF